ncbi:MAG: hypothetical protein ACM3XO_19015 [Bacteroidota bacterium]
MWDAKMVADLITAARGLLGFVMIWLGLTQGTAALPAVALLMLADWIGDFVDGSLAHRSRHPRRTWIGDSDLYIDLFVSLCLGVYLIAAGYVSLGFVGLYLAGWAFALWHFGLERNLLMLAQAPIYLYFIIIALRIVPDAGKWLVIWLLIATAINWRRFSREIVPGFIGGMRSIWDSEERRRHS